MLSILVLLAAGPQSAILATPQAPSADSRAAPRVLPPDCAPRPTPIDTPVATGRGLMWRDGDQPVGHHLLLERRVNGCPAPIVVNYRTPGSIAVGREAAPTPAERRR